MVRLIRWIVLFFLNLLCYSSLNYWIRVEAISVLDTNRNPDDEINHHHIQHFNRPQSAIQYAQPHHKLPKIRLFSSFMGEKFYPHYPLLFESMRFNPQVNFTIVYITAPQSTLYARHLQHSLVLKIKPRQPHSAPVRLVF